TVTALPPAGQGILYLADGKTPVKPNQALTPEQAATLVFKPAPNYHGSASIGFTVTDNSGAVSVPAQANLTINPVNDPPVVTNDGPVKTAPGIASTGNVLNNDSDVDGDPLTVTQFTVPGVSGNFAAGETALIPGIGALLVNADGSFIFTPNKGYSGPVPTVTYTVSDGNGGTDTGTLRFAAVSGDSNIGAVVMLANPTPPLFPPASGMAYSLLPFREPNQSWDSTETQQPSRLSLYGNLQDYDLYLTGSIRNQLVLETKSYTFSIPPGTFRHTNPNEELEYKATQLDGTPLPKWLHFDPKKLDFTGVPPKGAKNTEVLVTARDTYGNEAYATFKVVVNKDNAAGSLTNKHSTRHIQPSGQNAHANKMAGEYGSNVGKPKFTEQLGTTGKLGRIIESRALLD
ncbi:MAG: Ig-like domain-containing protein, partial [Sphingorhabdus sp.]